MSGEQKPPLPPGHRVPVPEQIVQWGNAVAAGLDDVLPRPWKFALYIFECQDEPGGRMFWISGAQRADVVKALQEWIAREGGS